VNYYDKELNITRDIGLCRKSDIHLCPQNKNTVEIIESIIDDRFDEKWIDSSSKKDNPHEFYNENLQLMMEVMRIDDHAYEDENGKIQNPTIMLESKLTKNIKKMDWYRSLPNQPEIVVSTTTHLPSIEDHNYKFYYKNFQRVVGHHIDKIPLYKKNHPGFKLIFLVLDESTMYGIVENELQAKKEFKQGDVLGIYMHAFCKDSRFLEVLINSGIDYLVWYTPYKHIDSPDGIVPIPTITVLDISEIKKEELINYPENLVISTEE